jgi:ABC-type phosphate transport system substrate-binding protein
MRGSFYNTPSSLLDGADERACCGAGHRGVAASIRLPRRAGPHADGCHSSLAMSWPWHEYCDRRGQDDRKFVGARTEMLGRASWQKAWVSLVTFAAAALPAAQASAQTSCAELPNPVVIPGTTDVKPFLARVAHKLGAAEGDEQLTILYQAIGSCTAIESFVTETELQGTAVYWLEDEDGEAEELTCDLEPGTTAHLALSDVNVETCTGVTPPSDIGEFASMVQTFGFVVPHDSTQQAITALEAEYLFTYGGEAGKQVEPWTDPQFVFIRNPSASTQLLIGLESGVPGTQWSANLTMDTMGSGGMIEQVAAQNGTGNAEQTLGILSAQRYDGARDQLTMLAFEAVGQECLGAVYPDSAPTAFDKRNVRDGHYTIWGYLWAVAEVDDDGTPVSPQARQFIDFLTGSEPINGADPIADAALAGGIPSCAMMVQREYDGAPLQSFQPDESCGCFYEATVTGEAGCDSCEEDADCSEGACHFGYCEAS